MSFAEKASALLLLKDSLGPFYDEQKSFLLEDVLGLPLVECAPVLSSLVSSTFITSEELAKLLARKMGGGGPKPKAEEVVPAQLEEVFPVKAEEVKEEKKIEKEKRLESSTPLSEVELYLKERVTSNKAEEFNNVIMQLQNNTGIQTLGELLNLEESHKSFNILDELLSSEHIETFISLLSILQESSFLQECKEEQKQKGALMEERRKMLENSFQSMYHFRSSEDAECLVVPINDKFHFYTTVELRGNEPSVEENKSQMVFFCLDISASMNHNEKGEYCAPKSIDHSASSIKKARELLPKLALAAIQRYASVYVITWNYKIQNVIEFTSDMFMLDDSRNLKPSDEIKAEIVRQTSERVFKAKGGTNIEAALDRLTSLMLEKKEKMASAIVWFLTDGEETVYVKSPTKMDRIPSNPSAENFSYFNNINNQGITQYQAMILNKLSSGLEQLSEQDILIDFHVCQFSEADPIFLRCMREASNGYFHTLVDVGNLESEIAAENSTSNLLVQILSGTSLSGSNFPAALNQGVLCARGRIPVNLFFDKFLAEGSMRIKKGKSVFVLDNLTVDPLEEKLANGIADIISLEPSLNLILDTLNQEMNLKTITEASHSLKGLRAQRMKALQSIIRKVRAGTMLQQYLETILESVASQIDCLERLLAQFQSQEGKAFDVQSARQNDILNQREKMAVSAGLESMRVRLGNGFVSQNALDKRICQLIAKSGTRARKMLHRRCILIETVKEEKTWLSLFIVDNDVLEEAKAKYTKKAFSSIYPDGNLPPYIEISLSYYHGDHPEDCLIGAEIFILNANKRHSAKGIPCTEFFPRFVAEYHCQPYESNLSEARKRFVDPLSYSDFIDLIQENNTLPAFLYEIGPSQSVGLLFNAKELLYVMNGGADSTSFDYFRLFWRLAPKLDANNTVNVPGTFSNANAALPMAPEPLTHLVLAHLMPGLLGEFVTGTPMAALSGSALLHGGFLMMHLHKEPVSSLDISRIVEIIATIAVWIQSPNTLPHIDEYEEVIQSLIQKGRVAPVLSPGKRIPVKALIYCLIEDNACTSSLFKALQNEIIFRMYKRHCNARDQSQNIDVRSQTLRFIERISSDEKDPNTGAPFDQIAKAEIVQGLLKQNAGSEEVTTFLRDPGHCLGLVEILSTVINDYETRSRWGKIQEVLYYSSVFAASSTAVLCEKFRNFEGTEDLEDHINSFIKDRNTCIPWEDTLVNWINENGEYLVLTCNRTAQQCFLWDATKKVLLHTYELTQFNDIPNSLKEILWDSAVFLLERWYWKGRKSNCFGLFEVDYEIVAALQDIYLLEGLSQVQSAEFHAALAHKKPAYAEWVPEREKEVVFASEDKITFQPLVPGSGKPRISLIVIGAVDSGKSTTSGHLIYARKGIDESTMQKIERVSKQYGKNNVKYAWLMDRMQEERGRGVTINIGLWSLETEKYEMDLLDAPGHRSFLKNMAKGAALADAALLIVSAIPGHFQIEFNKNGGMARQEAMLACASGVRQFIVGVNKMDLVDYSEDAFNEVQVQVSKYLKKLGVPPHRQIFIPISGWKGDNLVDHSKNMRWFPGWECQHSSKSETIRGITLLDAIDYGLDVPRRACDLPLRIPVLETYKIPGVGTIASGRIITGTLRVGEELTLAPYGLSGKAVSIECHHKNKREAFPGDIVGIKIKNARKEDILRGSMISPTAEPALGYSCFIAKVMISNHDNVRVNFSPYFYCHTASFPGKFVALLEKLDKSGKSIEKNPSVLHRGDVGIVKIVTEKPVAVDIFQNFPPLARFVIQTCSDLVGIGQIREVFQKDPDQITGSSRQRKRTKYFN